MNTWQLIIYGVAGFSTAILSGIAGAGGGFVMTPLLIFLGLTPAQAVASGKFNGLAVTIGSLTGMRKHSGTISRLKVGSFMLLAFFVGLLVPFAIRSLNSRAYRVALGVLLLFMIPIMIYKKVGLKTHTPTRLQKVIGGILLTLSLFLQGLFSGGLGSLVNIVLMGLLGLSATEANVTKRWSQLILNVTIILGVLGSHLIIWRVVMVGLTGSLVGSYIGGRIALKKGDTWIMNVMLGLILVSAVLLIIGAG